MTASLWLRVALGLFFFVAKKYKLSPHLSHLTKMMNHINGMVYKGSQYTCIHRQKQTYCHQNSSLDGALKGWMAGCKYDTIINKIVTISCTDTVDLPFQTQHILLKILTNNANDY